MYFSSSYVTLLKKQRRISDWNNTNLKTVFLVLRFFFPWLVITWLKNDITLPLCCLLTHLCYILYFTVASTYHSILQCVSEIHHICENSPIVPCCFHSQIQFKGWQVLLDRGPSIFRNTQSYFSSESILLNLLATFKVSNLLLEFGPLCL